MLSIVFSVFKENFTVKKPSNYMVLKCETFKVSFSRGKEPTSVWLSLWIEFTDYW